MTPHDIFLQLEAGSSRRRLLDAVRSRVLIPAAVGRTVASAKKPPAVQRTASSGTELCLRFLGEFCAHVSAGVSVAADEKKYKSVTLGGGAVSSALAKAGEERRGSVSDLSKGVAQGGAATSISEAERKKIYEANSSRSSSAPGAAGVLNSRWLVFFSQLMLHWPSHAIILGVLLKICHVQKVISVLSNNTQSFSLTPFSNLQAVQAPPHPSPRNSNK